MRAGLLFLLAMAWPLPATPQEEVFIFEADEAMQVHAATLVETPEGLVAAWFGGAEEGHPDVRIWVARHDGGLWDEARPVAEGRTADGDRLPTWNPVLVQPRGGPLLLFYKVGPHPRSWWGMVKISRDGGRSWSQAVRLPEGYLGPVRAKPWESSVGALLMGSSTEDRRGWRTHLERYPAGLTRRGHYSQWRGGAGLPPGMSPWSLEALASADGWERTEPLNDPRSLAAIQPTILPDGSGYLRVLTRTRQGVVGEATSGDGGDTWTRLTRTRLPNPNAALDAVVLPDGRALLAYNPTADDRSRLSIAVAGADGLWSPVIELENGEGEYSYPAMIQARDGRIHVAYTWRRERIRHVVIDPRNIP
jgi:predicted neuraminidase